MTSRIGTAAQGQVRLLLRSATGKAHLALHGHPLLRPLTEANLSLPAYRTALAALFGFHGPCERLLQVAPDPPRSARAPLLEADLAALGLAPAAIAALPVCSGLPSCQTEAECLGQRYVLDGSFHGGKVIAVNVIRQLGLGPTTGASFFNGVGIDTGSEWAALVAALDQRVVTGNDRDRVIEAAVNAFAALTRWLDQQAAVAATTSAVATAQRGLVA